MGIATLSGMTLSSLIYGWLAFRPKGSQASVTSMSWFTESKADIAWNLALKSYCSDYSTMPWSGVVSDFTYSSSFSEATYDTQGYIGTSSS